MSEHDIHCEKENSPFQELYCYCEERAIVAKTAELEAKLEKAKGLRKYSATEIMALYEQYSDRSFVSADELQAALSN